MTTLSPFDRCKLLPPEVLELVFDQVRLNDLPSVLLASTAFYATGSRSLYRSIACPDTTRRRVLLLRTLANSGDPTYHPSHLPNPALAVRVLNLDFHPNTVSSNLLRLVQRVLHAVTNLRELQLEFSSVDNYQRTAWCLHGTTFRLQKLFTSVALDDAFAAWLADARQASIAELSLRGHQRCPPPLALAPAALPRLASFRSVHLDSRYNALFLRGRPVESVALTLFPLSRLRALDAVTLTSAPVRRLTVLCLEEQCADALVAEVAARVPALESLHVVILAVPFTDVRSPSLRFSAFVSVLMCALTGEAGRACGVAVRVQGAALHHVHGAGPARRRGVHEREGARDRPCVVARVPDAQNDYPPHGSGVVL